MIETTPSAVPKFTESDKFAKDTSKNVKVKDSPIVLEIIQI